MKFLFFIITFFFLNLSLIEAQSDKKTDSYYELLDVTRRGDLSQVKDCFVKQFKNIPTEKYPSLLLEAASFENKDIFHYFIENGINIDSTDKDGNTALYIAVSGDTFIEYNKIQVVPFLLEAGLNPDIANKENSTALLKAMENNDYEIVKILLTKADPNVINRGYPLFFQAVNTAESSLVEAFLKAGVNLNLKDDSGDNVIISLIRGSSMLDILEILKLLIDAGADINATNNSNNTALHFAIDKGKYKELKILLDAGANPNLQNEEDGFTPLIFCAKTNRYRTKIFIKNLIESHAEINIKDKKGNTALNYAMDNRDYDIINLLIDAGADVGVKDHEGFAPLILASIYYDNHLVKKIIDAGADINTTNNDGIGALCFAIYNDRFDNANTLIDAGVNLNAKSREEYTPLMLASRKPDKDLIKKMISKGARLDDQDNEGKTALMYASRDYFQKNAQLLINAGADITLKDKAGKTAADYTTETNNRHKEQGIKLDQFVYRIDNIENSDIEYLIDNKLINIEVEDISYSLFKIAQNKNKKLLQYLVNEGISLDTINSKDNTPLAIAIKEDDAECVKTLLSVGANPNIINKQGMSHLMFALKNENTDIVKYLIAKSDINIQNNKGETALMYAVGSGNQMLAQLLIDAKADLNIRDTTGYTALFNAINSAEFEMANLLINAGADLSIKNNKDQTVLDYVIKRNQKTKRTFTKEDNIYILEIVSEPRKTTGINKIYVNTKTGKQAILKDIDGKIYEPHTLEWDDLDYVKLLLKDKSVLNNQNKDGETPLMIAIREKNNDVISLLIDAGANINIQNNMGETALIVAVKKYNKESIEPLVKAKTNLKIKDNSGKTAFDYAEEYEYSNRMLDILKGN